MAGSIIKRGENTYRLEVCMGSDSRGMARRFTKTVHVKTKKEAQLELAKFYLECEKNKNLNITDCTVKEFTKIWWSEYVELYTKRSTWRGYKTALCAHIIPDLGDIKLRNLKEIRVQKWVNDMVKTGLSAKTIRNYYSVMYNIAHYALKWGYLNINPCEDIILPKKKKKEAKYYNLNEVKCLLKALESVSDDFLDYKVSIYLALFGGLRKGEILGINENDVLFDSNQIKILRTRMIAPDIGVYEDNPKTETSIRIICLPDEIIDMIKELLKKQAERKNLLGSRWKDSEALIKGLEGGALYPQNLQRWFTKFLQENELPHIGLHGLRHTHTAMLISMTNDITQISKRLGHSETSITLNTYAHLFEDKDKQLAAELSKIFLK